MHASESDLPDDQFARERALCVHESFIVQAPAGSGKTELLSNRLLALLAHCDTPETILAITFTRDAAAEMRARVLAKLQWANTLSQQNTVPEKAHEKSTFELAKKVLLRDREQGWQLLAQPARLRIMTIDALCAALTRQMPYLSQLGGQARIADDSEALYREAAQRTLLLLEETVHRAPIQHLLEQCDNSAENALTLLVDMLRKRDQWLPYLFDNERNNARYFETQIRKLLDHELQSCAVALPRSLQQQLLPLAAFAAANVSPDNKLFELANWLEPLDQTSSLRLWKTLRAWLLTGEGEIRQRITKNEGFPAEKKTEKKQFQDILSVLSEQNVADSLRRVDYLPDPDKAAEQWPAIALFLQSLNLAAAQLRVLFSERSEVDYMEVSQAALSALGDDDEPTDLSLSLDYRLQHILVDEFQDTSRTQWKLLQKLVAGWENGDGRTLFLVGDPMQSIYRFRKAEVALFLRAQQHGLRADLPLTSITLSRNFRSQKNLIEWFNTTFKQVFPARPDAVYSAVPYVQASATVPPELEPAVDQHLFVHDNNRGAQQRAQVNEAERVAHLAKTALDRGDKEVAILVKARSHAGPIVTALNKAGLAFCAIDMASLNDSPLVSDLQQLARALWHAGDRLAWLTVLRAPWCGLTARDLFLLCGTSTTLTVYEQVNRTDWTLLSAEGAARLSRCWPILTEALMQQDARPLPQRVEACWLALQGDYVLQNDLERADVEQFFKRLFAVEWKNVDVLSVIDNLVNDLHAQSDVAAPIKLLTLHKAKGLEFDCVIVPGLNRTPPSDRNALLMWDDYADEQDDALLIAPIEHRMDEGTAMHTYLRQREKRRAEEENKRLLYVAATRAKKQLHWLACVSRNTAGDIKPAANSLLQLLWPVMEASFVTAAQVVNSSEHETQDVFSVPLIRLSSDWQAPVVDEMTSVQIDSALSTTAVSLTAQGRCARALGVVTHYWLEQLAKAPLPENCEQYLDRHQDLIRKQLFWEGLNHTEVADVLPVVLMALRNGLSDENGRRLLSYTNEARSEWALTRDDEQGFSAHIIDRTFVDEHGVRWIVDYKTTRMEGEDWLAQLQKKVIEYRPQLQRYGELLAKMETRPQKLALYFPLQKQLIEL